MENASEMIKTENLHLNGLCETCLTKHNNFGNIIGRNDHTQNCETGVKPIPHGGIRGYYIKRERLSNTHMEINEKVNRNLVRVKTNFAVIIFVYVPSKEFYDWIEKIRDSSIRKRT